MQEEKEEEKEEPSYGFDFGSFQTFFNLDEFESSFGPGSYESAEPTTNYRMPIGSPEPSQYEEPMEVKEIDPYSAPKMPETTYRRPEPT